MFIFCYRSCVLTVATALTGALLSIRRTDVLEWFPWQDMCKGVRPCWKKKSSHVDEIKIHFLLQGNAELRVLVKRCWEDDLKKIQTSLSSS